MSCHKEVMVMQWHLTVLLVALLVTVAVACGQPEPTATPTPTFSPMPSPPLTRVPAPTSSPTPVPTMSPTATDTPAMSSVSQPLGGPVGVEARLIFRRAFKLLADQRGWDVPDILMEEALLMVP